MFWLRNKKISFSLRTKVLLKPQNSWLLHVHIICFWPLKRCVTFSDAPIYYCLFCLILYIPPTIFQLNRDGSSLVEPVLSQEKCVLLKDHNAVKPVRLEPAALRSRVKHSTTEPLRSPTKILFVCLFDLILYIPSTIFQLYRDRSSWVKPVLS